MPRGRVEVKVNTRGFSPHLEQVRRAAAHGLSDALEDVRDDARLRARDRQRTGEMADSIERTPVVSMASGKGFVGRVYIGVWYGVLQELGTHAHKGRPKSKRTADTRKAKGIVSGVKPGRFLRNALYSANRGGRVTAAIARRVR